MSREIDERKKRKALRKLRKFARTGTSDELDLPGTISETAREGFLSVQTQKERQNAIKLLLLLDIGGSMDDHVRVCEELFSAAKGECKSLTHYYFHNGVYGGLWTHNARRRTEQTPTDAVIRTFPPDTRLVIVGDAAMSPYEIAYPGGANEHWNQEAGQVWLQRARDQWASNLWINPVPEKYWGYTHSIGMIREIFGTDAMVPMTLEGLARGMRALTR